MLSSIPIKYKQFSNWTIWPIDGIVVDNATPGQSRPACNAHEGMTQPPSELQNKGHTIRCSLMSCSGHHYLGGEGVSYPTAEDTACIFMASLETPTLNGK